VITFYHWTIQFADTFHAFSRICVVTDHVAQTHELGTSTLARIRQYRFERFKVSVDITQNCETHREIRPLKGYNVAMEAFGHSQECNDPTI
jgi:hypothetical protein